MNNRDTLHFRQTPNYRSVSSDAATIYVGP